METSRSVASAAEGSGAITEGRARFAAWRAEAADQAGQFSRRPQALIERSDRRMEVARLHRTHPVGRPAGRTARQGDAIRRS
jgi:hypothetical protein